MNTEAYSKITELFAPALERCAMKPFKMGDEPDAKTAYMNDSKAVLVDYLEDKMQFVLLSSNVTDGVADDTWTTVSAWLFDSRSDERDIRSIAGDFSDTLYELCGLKRSVSVAPSTVSGPAKAKDGEDITPEALAQKVLAVFPSLRETYAAEVAEKGEFMYADFFSRFAAPAVREVLVKNDRKKCEKLFDMFNNAYVCGTSETRAALTVVILAGAVDNDPELRKAADSYTEKHTYLRLVMPPVYKQYTKLAKSR